MGEYVLGINQSGSAAKQEVELHGLLDNNARNAAAPLPLAIAVQRHFGCKPVSLAIMAATLRFSAMNLMNSARVPAAGSMARAR